MRKFLRLLTLLEVSVFAIAGLTLYTLIAAFTASMHRVENPPVTQVVAPAASGGVPASSPVIVQQSSHDGFFTGMLMGHLLSGRFNSGPAYANHTTHVTKNVTVVNKTPATAPRNTYRPVTSYRPAPSYRPSYRSFRPSYSSYRSYSSFGGRR